MRNDVEHICCGCCYAPSIEYEAGSSVLALEGTIVQCPECNVRGKLVLADDEGYQWLEHHPLPRELDTYNNQPETVH